MPDIASVLLVTSVLLVIAFVLLTVSLMRLRRTTRQLQAALEDESGARDRAGLLLAIASAVNSSLALEEVLNVALTHAGRIMGAVAGAMYLVTPGKNEMRRQAEYNLSHRAKGAVRHLEEEPLRTALAAMRPMVLGLADEASPGLEAGGHPQHVLVVPMQRAGQLMGAMELYLNAWRELTDDQADLLNGVASQGAIAIRHAQLFQAQEENALTDELTKLPNRRALAQQFLREMHRARRYNKSIAFLMIDIDHFKQVNDRYGHAVGDETIVAVAGACAKGKRQSDIVGRLGGEEFAILLPETELAQATIVADRLCKAIAEHVMMAHKVQFKVTASIGIAAASVSMSGLDVLMRAADQALFQAKAQGRNCAVQWSPPEAPKLAAE